MLELTRTVRFSVNPAPPAPSGGTAAWGPATNTFAAYPTMQGLGRYYEVDVRCRGEADPVTGYFVNIKEIDQATRSVLIPRIERACRGDASAEPGTLLREAMPALDDALGGEGRLTGVRWRLSPYYSVEVSMANLQVAIMRQQFEFAAAHRLHVPGLSDERNREVFGKCNNPSGHGHNYRVEPAVEVPVGNAGGFTLGDLERVTQAAIIQRFDHKHLNVDTAEFASGTGLNPSVENIAKVCYDLLEPAVRGWRAGSAARLRSVTVWETDKTSCTYPA